jgi:glycine hydroxymethyltransferase
METVADFLHRAVQIALQAQKEAGTKLLKDFVTAYSGNGEASQQLAALKKDVVAFATQFPLPGVPDSVSAMRRFQLPACQTDILHVLAQSKIKRPEGY